MAFHNYKPFTLSVYIAASDTIRAMHELTDALLTYDLGKFGHSVCHDVTPQLWKKSDGKRKHSAQGDSCNF